MFEDPDFKDDELKELISNIRKNNQIRFFVFVSFLILAVGLRLSEIIVPWSVIIIIVVLLFGNIACEFLARTTWPKRTVSYVSNLFFILQILEVIALIIAISEFEAVLFGGIAILMLYVVFCYLGFTRRLYPRILAFFCIVGYIIAGLLKFFHILEYEDLQGLGINPFENNALVVSVMTFMIGAFIYLSFYEDVFSEKLRETIGLLRNRTSQLVRREKESADAKTVLEIRVEARTQELRELTDSLNKQVKRRTKELQEKIKELEKFQRLSVGRELKMIELKKENKELKKSLKEKEK